MRRESGPTNTGWLAASEPNLQNIPIRTKEGRRIRRAHLRTLISQMYTARDFRRYREYEALKRTFRQAWSKRHDR